MALVAGGGIEETRIALISGTREKEWVHSTLEAIEVSLGVTAGQVVSFVEVSSGITKGLKMSDTMKSVLATSSLKALNRRSKVVMPGILFIGRDNRVCQDFAKLGVVTHRVPYGLSEEAWGDVLSKHF